MVTRGGDADRGGVSRHFGGVAGRGGGARAGDRAAGKLAAAATRKKMRGCTTDAGLSRRTNFATSLS